MDLNNVCLTGRLTKDVELRVTPTGAEVVSFTLAVDDYGKENNTYFINCVAWNHQAKFLNQYCSKGNLLAVNGKLTSRSYDRKDGTKAYVVEVVANQVLNTTPRTQVVEQPIKEEKETNYDAVSYDAVNEIPLAYQDDDLPF